MCKVLLNGQKHTFNIPFVVLFDVAPGHTFLSIFVWKTTTKTSATGETAMTTTTTKDDFFYQSEFLSCFTSINCSLSRFPAIKGEPVPLHNQQTTTNMQSLLVYLARARIQRTTFLIASVKPMNLKWPFFAQRVTQYSNIKVLAVMCAVCVSIHFASVQMFLPPSFVHYLNFFRSTFFVLRFALLFF